ncbi:hypothetical protein [Silvibacterium sp.]|uniref:hypothetical protein n=1 Tax=Silvibacterium sp. TaxID=1964179 RepID=UPI0039E2DA35
MKRTRHVSIEIEQRKLTLVLTPGGVPASRTSSTDDSSRYGAGPDVSSAPPVCPACGASWIVVTAYAAEADTPCANTLPRLLQQHGLHLHAFPDGRLWLCSRSLEQARFDEIL